VHIDGTQKLGSTMKFADFKEPFHYCAIGAPYSNIRKLSTPKLRHQRTAIGDQPQQQSQERSLKLEEKSKGLFPNIIERSFFPGLVSQVPHYFTLPIKTNSSSLDPSVKSFPNGMQDLIFGEPICLRGQIGNILLADTSINVKQLFDAGTNFANLLAVDLIESFDLGSKYIFCFSPSACFDGLCVDLAPGNRYNGHIMAHYCQSLSIQDSINGIGGIMALFPILEHIATTHENFTSSSELISLSPSVERPSSKDDTFGDWEMLQLTSLSEAKINQNPIACFLCLLRNFVVGYEWNQQCLLNLDGIATLAAILRECNTNIIDVNVLMSLQLLVEAIQNEVPAANLDLLHVLYKELVFDFRIWSKAQFQIIIGHIQYISTIIKDDRKYFR
jgi:neurobeachin-like protein 1/2